MTKTQIPTGQDCSDWVAGVFKKEYERVANAIKNKDLSEATFPRVGEEAVIELITRREVMQWVLEMLNIE